MFQIGSQNLASQLLVLGVPYKASLLLADESYVCPQLSWVQNEFSGVYREWLARFRLSYMVDLWDCDDYTRLASTLASLCHAETPMAKECGLAFGEFWYRRRLTEPHAINAFCVALDTQIQLRFWEPQTQLIINLSQEEIETCTLLRF